jgi:hypothetical protein
MKIIFVAYIFLIFLSQISFSQTITKISSSFTIARIKYGGGGDWYGNQTSLNNVLKFLKENTNIDVADKEVTIEIKDEQLFNYPFIYIAGHGNIKFTDQEVIRLRTYLINGGFLFADDDYGMDKFFRREMKKVFPDKEFVELPFSHEIYNNHFSFPNGLPKIHEHDGGPPHGYGIFHEGRLVVFYSFNTDISDGCENFEIHKDPPEKHISALKMATNIIVWALSN